MDYSPHYLTYSKRLHESARSWLNLVKSAWLLSAELHMKKSEVTPVISEHRKEDYSILFGFLHFFSAAAARFGCRRETI